MIPDKNVKEFVEWTVGEVYDEWESFAIETSIFAYELAIKRSQP